MLSKRAKRDYRLEAAPMLILAFGLGQAGIAALIDPKSADITSVAQLLDDDYAVLEFFWQISYIASGLFLTVGVLKPWPIVEVLGDWLAAWAMSINLLALLIVRGPGGTGAAMGSFLLAILICGLRIHRLHLRAAMERRSAELPFDGPDRRRYG